MKKYFILKYQIFIMWMVFPGRHTDFCRTLELKFSQKSYIFDSSFFFMLSDSFKCLLYACYSGKTFVYPLYHKVLIEIEFQRWFYSWQLLSSLWENSKALFKCTVGSISPPWLKLFLPGYWVCLESRTSPHGPRHFTMMEPSKLLRTIKTLEMVLYILSLAKLLDKY